MSFGGSGSIHTEEPRVLALRVNQSAYGGAKARVWGKCRVPGNMLDYMDFNAIPHTTTQSSGGGKGGGGMESSNTSYTYTSGVVIGLCTGVIAGIGKVWQDKDVTDLAALGFTLKTGALRQAIWSHLSANHPAHAVNYSGIAFVANSTFDLGSSASQPNLSFEVFGERIITGADDAAPADIIYDIVADPLEGVGLPSDILANLADYALWCSAMGLSLSLAATSQTPARDVIAQLLKATMAEPVWSAGKIKIIPYGDEPVGAWAPNNTPVYDLTESDFLEAPRHKRTQPADAVNRVTLNYTSRAKDYNTVTLTRDDLSAVTQYGPRPETLDLTCISRESVAVTACEFWRDRGLYIRNRWEFVVDERFCLVESMDLLTLTFGHQHLDHVPVRVVETDDDGAGRITMLVEEWPFGLLKPTAIPSQSVSGYVPEQNIAPGATNAPVIFEAPNQLTAPALEIWIGASGGAHWGGAHVWVSDSGDSYQQVGTITNPARHGVLTSLLAAGSDPDITHTLHVDMSISGAQLLSGTQADADNGNTLCWVDGELVSYQTATLTSPSRYDLIYLRRGQQGTASDSHSAGAQFLRLDEAVFKYRVPRDRIGSAVWIKLQSFNTYGRSPEPLDLVAATQYTISGNKPLPLASLSATGGMFLNSLAWTFVANQYDRDYIEIYGSTSNDRATALPLTSAKNPTSAWKHPGLLPAQTWYYWGRVVDTSGNASDFYPLSATGGVASAPSADPSSLLTQLQNSVGLGQLTAELSSPITLIPEIVSTLGWNQQTDDIATAAGVALFSGSVVSAGAKVATEQITRETADSALASTITTVSAATQAAAAAIQTEETARANADSALASRATSLEASVNSVTTGLNTKASVGYVDAAKADAISASATAVAVVQARLDTGDYAAVKTQSSASVSRLGIIEAKHSVKVDVNGHVAGTELISDGTVGSFIILADQFLVVKPDGTGTPKQVLTLGTVNGVSALGLDGNLIVDGSIVARTLAAGTITADKINGTNLDVVNGTFSGSLSAATGVFSGALNGATGTFSGKLSAGILDPSAFVGREYSYGTPGTYLFTVPSDTGWPSITLRVTLQGAGGGGGGGNSGNDGYSYGSGGGGGGAGAQVVYTVGGVTAGQQFSIVVGSGGGGGANYTLSGSAGGATVLSGYVSASGGLGGAHGNRDAPYTAVGGSLGGGEGTLDLDSGHGFGGSGGGSAYAGGGQGGTYYSTGGMGGYGAGGGGGGSSGWNPNDVETAGGAGGAGFAKVEVYDPNGVVLNGRYSSLVTWLDGIGHGAVPTNAR